MKALLTRNLGLKVLSLVIGFFLWVLLTGEKETVRVYPLPIDFVLDETQALTGEVPGSISTSIRGPELLLQGVDPANLKLSVDLRDYPAGQARVVLDPGKNLVGLPTGLAVEALSPQILTLTVERKTTRRLPVMPRVEGQPPVGCLFGGYELSPSEVLVEGPESSLLAMSLVHTEPIDISGHCSTFSVAVPLALETGGIHLVSPRPITVTLRLEEEPASAIGAGRQDAGRDGTGPGAPAGDATGDSTAGNHAAGDAPTSREAADR